MSRQANEASAGSNVKCNVRASIQVIRAEGTRNSRNVHASQGVDYAAVLI